MAKSLLSSARVRALSIICGVALFAAGCGGQDTRPLTTMSPKGEQAKDIDSLARLIFYVAGVVFVQIGKERHALKGLRGVTVACRHLLFLPFLPLLPLSLPLLLILQCSTLFATKRRPL